MLSVIDDKTPMPPPGATEEEEALNLQDDPYIERPIKVDYGFNVKYVALLLLQEQRLIVID